MHYEVAAVDEFDTELAPLHGRLIATHPRFSRRYLDWKYAANPCIQPPIMHVVRLGERIVAMRGLYGTEWSLSACGPRVVLPHADDLIIDEAHRNRGLFLVLHRALVGTARERGFDAILSLSGGADTQELSLVCGYRELGDLERLHRPAGGHRLRRRVVGRLGRAARTRAPLPSLAAWYATMPDVAARLRASSGPRLGFERRIDADELAATTPHRHDHPASARTAEFYRWRLANPERVYRTLTWRDPALSGFLVLSFDPASPHRIMIAECAAESADVLDHLLRPFDRIDGVELVVMTPRQAELREVFERHGFVPLADESGWTRRRFLYFPLTEAGELSSLAEFPAGWRIDLLDTMAA